MCGQAHAERHVISSFKDGGRIENRLFSPVGVRASMRAATVGGGRGRVASTRRRTIGAATRPGARPSPGTPPSAASPIALTSTSARMHVCVRSQNVATLATTTPEQPALRRGEQLGQQMQPREI